MFDRIRRLFGAGPSATPTSAPLDSPPRAVATIEVESPRGWLVAQDAAGTTLLATGVTTGMDPILAGSWAAFGTPEGDYLIETVLPARTDEAGVALFGPHPMLRLRAMTGRTRPNRTVLLIHGGPAGRPTDGSIRMDDADLLTLLALLPADLGRVRVRLTRSAVDADDSGAGWGDDGRDDDTSLYYGQLYAWDGTAPGSSPYPDVPAGDEAVGSALAGLGYSVLPDGSAPASDAGTTAGAGTVDAGLSALSAADEGWSPAGGAYSP